MNNPEVSVIIPVYNCKEYLSYCLNSLQKQTFKNIEIIIVNDGSTDGSKDIILDYAAGDNRIKYFEQVNSGVSASRNKGFEISSGEYIIFVDSDDWVSPDYIEKLYNALIKESCDISVCSVLRAYGKKDKYRLHYLENKVYSDLEDKIKICDVPNCCYVCGKMYKKEIIKDLRFKEGVFFEDVLWLPEALKKSPKLITVSDCIYYYRVNKNSIVRTIPNAKKQQDSYNAKKYIVQFFKENNLPLSKKESNVTRRIIYFLGLQVLKLKEYKNINTWYLFSFIPVLRFRDTDSCYIFNFLGIKFTIKH